MQEFLLIVISMLLGFWQGLKKRNKKNNIKIKEYERKLLEKESEIERLKHRIRLEQYNNGTLKKKNKDRLETELTSYVTTSKDNFILTANAYTIINIVIKENMKKDMSYMTKELFVDQLQTDIETYLEDSELEGTNIDLLAEYFDGNKKLINPYEANNCFKKWTDEFDLNIYSISLHELIDTMHLILYEINFEKDI
jgi:ATP-dependent Lon protease